MDRQFKAFTVLFLLVVFLGGCSIGGGSTRETNKPTLGQELIDLKRALDASAISEEEYRRLKQQLKSSGR